MGQTMKRFLAGIFALVMTVGSAATVFADNGISIPEDQITASDSFFEETAEGDANIYRITKITDDVTVTITTQADAEPAAASKIDADTIWNYTDDGTDPAQGQSSRTAWTAEDYDASGWKTGKGSFGAKYGEIADLGGGCTPNTLLNQYKEDAATDIEAFFFRAQVNIADASAVTGIKGSLTYDDAATVYVNGVRIAGFDDDGITENIQYGGSNAGNPITAEILSTDTSMLHNGVNTVAVEIHQGRSSSSDVYFNMSELYFDTAPIMADQQSINISMGADATQRNFTWYANVSGEGILKIAAANEVTDGVMPESAKSYNVTGRTASNKSGYYTYQATASDLAAETEYAYQVVNGTTESEIHTFTTGTGNAFSFAFAGDPQIGASGNAQSDTTGWGNTLKEIAENNAFEGIDFLLSAGDQVNTANNESQYDGYLNHDELLSLPVATIVGNHDSSSAAYDEHFNVPNESGYGATTASRDYYFVYNKVLFLIINSNSMSTAEHKQFMEEAIAATADQDIKWKIVAFHHSIYSVASHAYDSDIITRRNELVPVFKDLDIDVVLMGHDHVYCRSYMMDGFTPITDTAAYDDENYSSVTDPEGILYVTANSASGSKFYNIKNEVFNYSAVQSQEKIPNVSRVDITDSSFTITTYRTQSTTGAGELSEVDTFTIYKGTTPEPHEHQWDDGVITKQPSITEEGIRTYTCKECQETKTEAIAKLDPAGKFTDIDNCGDTAKSAIIWAADKGIVNGYSGDRAGQFGPTDSCTRQQMMIMLWRAAGCPEPQSAASAEIFKDSSMFGASGKLAIAWGVENAIVGGYTRADGKYFDPNGTVTRAQTAVMMWRVAEKPEPKSTSAAFTDIADQSAGVKTAIYWAAENAITQGKLQADGTYKFNPTDPCQRQHIAIFVYRLIPVLDNNK